MVMKNLKNRELLLRAANIADVTLHHKSDCNCVDCEDLRSIRTEIRVLETKAIRVKAEKLIKEGKSRTQVAEKLGISKHNLRLVLLGKLVEEYKKRPHPRTLERRKRVVKYYKEGLSTKQIAEIEKRSAMTILKDLNSMGIEVVRKKAS